MLEGICRQRIRLVLLCALALAATGCVHHERHRRLRLGPALCPEGPPSWSASDGRRLAYRKWAPASAEPRAVIVAAPGWNGTACDAEPLGRRLAKRGIAVYSVSMRGQHGDLSAAARRAKGNVDSGQLWESDLAEFTEWVHRRHPGTPLFLYGQSMGALTTMLVSMHEERDGGVKPRGVILHSPAVAMMYPWPVVRVFTDGMRALYPHRLLFSIGLIPGDKPALTNNPKFDLYWGVSRDRVRPGYTWAFFDESLRLGARARNAAEHLHRPVLVLTGDQDPIGTAGVGQEAFARLMRIIPSPEKQRRRFPNGYHDLFHDSNAEAAVKCIGDWVEEILRR